MHLSQSNRISLHSSFFKIDRHLKYKFRFSLFGSQLNGTPTAKSDIDIMVELQEIDNPDIIWSDIHTLIECFLKKTGLNVDLHLYTENNDIVTKDMPHQCLYESRQHKTP